jgi:hypothetical protein
MSVCIYSVFVLSCAQVAALRRADPLSKELPTVYRIKKLKSGQGPMGCRAVERERERERDKHTSRINRRNEK